jgi:nucleoside-specific outer membrane channel protein Tsx
MKKILNIIPLIFLINIFLINNINAQELWSSNSVSLLYGTTFKVPQTTTSQDLKRYVTTLEHISENSWGDIFSFLDLTRSTETQNTNIYGEFTPRLSLFKISNYSADKKDLFSDFLLALNLEYGSSPTGFNQLNYLVGIGTNINLAFFQYLKLNFLRRIDQRNPDSWQLTPVFGAPFSVGNADFRIDGWADFVSSTKTTPINIHTQIQLKWDIGKAITKKKDTFYVGTEFKYWRNKFGISGITELVWQALAQVRF